MEINTSLKNTVKSKLNLKLSVTKTPIFDV